ncbi:hypothetical protein J2Y66_003723 [Paenarthrobacter nitroguajacolicus]|nr:hypothetical protein [Paenarthrobacter nitroguajacolicus]
MAISVVFVGENRIALRVNTMAAALVSSIRTSQLS